MDAPIAPAALRKADEGPAYDLISLGLVVFTILLITVWTTHFFRQQPADVKDLGRVIAQAAHDPDSGALTAAGHLEAAKWADFNLPSPDGNHITNEFRDHLKSALELDARERAWLQSLMAQPHGDGFDRVSAKTELSHEGAARVYARDWYRRRAAWLDSCDTDNFDVRAHFEVAMLLKDLDMVEEAAIELGKIIKARPDLQGVPPVDDQGLPVIRKFKSEGAK